MSSDLAMKLNLGCGRSPKDDYVNLDYTKGPGVDVAFDLDSCATEPLPFPDDFFAFTLASHVIEHLHHPLELFGELWRVTRNRGTCEVAMPYGSSDDAWEDLTHVRPWFVGSFLALGQPYYWRADYGYTGDWRITQIVLDLKASQWQGISKDEIASALNRERNVVVQMTAMLEAIKPARPPQQSLLTQPPIALRLVDHLGRPL